MRNGWRSPEMRTAASSEWESERDRIAEKKNACKPCTVAQYLRRNGNDDDDVDGELKEEFKYSN